MDKCYIVSIKAKANDPTYAAANLTQNLVFRQKENALARFSKIYQEQEIKGTSLKVINESSFEYPIEHGTVSVTVMDVLFED